MNKIEKGVCYLEITLIFLATLISIFTLSEYPLLKYISITVLDLLVIYNELFNYKENNKNTLILAISAFIIVNLTFAFFTDDIYIMYLIIILFQILRVSIKCYYLLFILSIVFINASSIMHSQIFFSNLILLIGNAFIYLLYYIILQSKSLEKSKQEILLQSIQTEFAYEKLKEAYDKVENYSVLKERDRIARQMHDTVGHSLTLSLVTLENYYRDKVSKEDADEFNIIIESVRKSLYNLRTTVHKIRETDNWCIEIDKLIENLKEENIINITYNRDDIRNIDNATGKCIYTIIQEGITNGIKHGNAKAFIIAVKIIDNNLIIRVINNGKASSSYKKGFGLNSMEESINSLGGSLEIESSIEDGFTLTAYIPYKEGEY